MALAITERFAGFDAMWNRCCLARSCPAVRRDQADGTGETGERIGPDFGEPGRCARPGRRRGD